LKYVKMKIYPIGRIRGCSMNCEFCSVKGKPRWAEGRYLFNVVKWLVETRRACHFFIVDDRLEEDLEGTLDFFRMISDKYGSRLCFTVQTRLETAKNTKLLEVMKKAGVRYVFIGYESPIDEDLKVMRKGYSSSNMLEWTKVLRRYFWVHGMFIFGYPSENKASSLTAKEKFEQFRKFICQASLDTIQILLPIPLVGTVLRERLKKAGKIFPLELVPWSKYDGAYPCFRPDDTSARELQEAAIKLMKRVYNPWSLVRILLRIVSFPIYLLRGWRNWYRGWYRDVIKYGGHLLIQRWRKRQKKDKFMERLEKY